MNSDFKHKTIAAYIALTHHTRFLTPIMNQLERLGARVIYIVGQAERSQEVTAINTGLNYVHVFDYVNESDRNEIDENYRALRDGVADGIRRDVAIGSTNALTVLDKTLHASAKEYVGFRNFLEEETPDICFALHELNRWGKMMAFWAKKMGIPVLTLQEGLYVASNYLFIGHVQYSTLNLVWGTKTREKLIGYEAPGERIIPVGNTHIAQEIITLGKNNTRETMRQKMGLEDKTVVLIMFSATPPPMDDILPLFERLKDDGHVRLVCKFHPVTGGLVADQWKEKIPGGIKNTLLFFHEQESTYSLIAMSDLCVLSEPSTTGLEALAIGKPLVQLKLTKPEQYPYDFVKDGVALHLTPDDLAGALAANQDFCASLPGDTRDRFIKEELIDTTGATDRIVSIVRNVFNAKDDTPPGPLLLEGTVSPERPVWSIILPVSDTPERFLAVLEAVSAFSEGIGAYEVILVLQAPPSSRIQMILNSLEGDITLVHFSEGRGIAEGLNKAALRSHGQRLVFLSRDIAPSENWLANLDDAYDRHGDLALLGARVVNRHQNIMHAGMVVDANNVPVSAYQHLDEKFPSALKERPFQMLDHFLSMERSCFGRLGGFHPKTNKFRTMDICLRAGETNEKHAIYYLPKVKMTCLSSDNTPVAQDESIYFFSRWHHALWESEASLYKADSVSQLQLDSARMTRAMGMLGR